MCVIVCARLRAGELGCLCVLASVCACAFVFVFVFVCICGGVCARLSLCLCVL